MTLVFMFGAKLAELALPGKRYFCASSTGVVEPGRLSSLLRKRFSADATVFTRDKVPVMLTRLCEEPGLVPPLRALK